MSENIASSIQDLAVPIESVRQYAKNPRIGDVKSLVRSLKSNGQYRPIVVRRETGEILAGNHTFKAAVELGWSEIAATFIDCDDDQAARIVLVDNRSNDVAEYDDAALVEVLQGLEDLTGTGYSQSDLASLLQGLGADAVREGLTDPDDVPDVPEKPEAVTRLGDVWSLGNHRLVCGDCTDRSVVERLMDGRQADLLLTDPPYGVDYAGKNEALNAADKGNCIQTPIEQDHLTGDALEKFLGLALDAAVSSMLAGAPAYVFLSDASRVQFEAALRGAKIAPRQTLIWAKQHFVLGRQDYQAQHEPILYGWKEGAAHRWFGGFDKSTVIECDRPAKSDLHPTTKPVELLERLITNSSQHGDAVLDVFGGSGSTLIACERLGRHAHLVELDPAYCDVIVKRWEDHTGRKGKVEHAKTSKA